MSPHSDESQPREKDWEPWHEPAANYADGDGHVTRADTEPRAFNSKHFRESTGDSEPPFECLYSRCDREFDAVSAHNHHVSQIHYQREIKVECAWCGERLHKSLFQAKNGSGVNFCGRSCASKWHAHNNHNHPAFHYEREYREHDWRLAIRDAEIKVSNRPRWTTQRKALHEQQSRCQLCGASGDDYPLHSHHLVPVLFGGASFEENLVVLCNRCHKRADHYIEEQLDDHFRLPRSDEVIRIFDSPSSPPATEECTQCGTESGGSIPVKHRPIIPMECGGSPDLRQPLCNRCYGPYQAFVFKQLIPCSDPLYGSFPNPDLIEPPDYDDWELPLSPEETGNSDQIKIPENELIEALQRLADELGRTPRFDEMDAGQYSATPYIRAFGTWNNAVCAAGLEPVRECRLTEEQLLEEIHRLKSELGRVPTQDDFLDGNYSPEPYYRVFGSLTEAIEAAGYEPIDGRGNEYSDDELLAELNRLKSKHGEVKRKIIDEFGFCSSSTIYKRFGTLSAAKNLLEDD